jgi:hypothetical protein
MAMESRKMAEDATWEKINNRVAWKLAEALEHQPCQQSAQNNNPIPSYSWLLLSPELRGWLISLIVNMRLVGGLGIIVGVWGGLVITWLLVQSSLFVRARAPWAIAFVRALM